MESFTLILNLNLRTILVLKVYIYNIYIHKVEIFTSKSVNHKVEGLPPLSDNFF